MSENTRFQLPDHLLEQRLSKIESELKEINRSLSVLFQIADVHTRSIVEINDRDISTREQIGLMFDDVIESGRRINNVVSAINAEVQKIVEGANNGII